MAADLRTLVRRCVGGGRRSRTRSMHEHDRLYIGGEWVEPAGTSTIDVISPHSEELVGRVPGGHRGRHGPGRRDRPRPPSTRARGAWPLPASESPSCSGSASCTPGRWARWPRSSPTEMGSPISFSNLAQSPAPWMMLNVFNGIAAEYPWEETRTGMLGTDVIVRREGVGVVAAIVPWNVPQFVIMSKLAPALLAGCSVVVKPSPETPLDAVLLADLLDGGRDPEGCRVDRPCRPGGRRAPRPPPACRQGRVHRIDRRRPSHRLDLRRAAEAGDARARRQVGGDHPRRRRHRIDGRGPQVRLAA